MSAMFEVLSGDDLSVWVNERPNSITSWTAKMIKDELEGGNYVSVEIKSLHKYLGFVKNVRSDGTIVFTDGSTLEIL